MEKLVTLLRKLHDVGVDEVTSRMIVGLVVEIAEAHAKDRRRHWTKAPRGPGFVYLMKNKRNGLTKIGYSTNPVVREATLQSEEPEVVLIATHPGTKADETELHDRFIIHRVRGEWFRLPECDEWWVLDKWGESI